MSLMTTCMYLFWTNVYSLSSLLIFSWVIFLLSSYNHSLFILSFCILDTNPLSDCSGKWLANISPVIVFSLSC